MAVVGVSLILASVIYVVFRRPPFIETLLAILRGSPHIEQPPSTARPPSSSPPPSITTSEAEPQQVNDDIPLQQTRSKTASPQTTPKASATKAANDVIPSFTLAADELEDTKAMPPPPIPKLSPAASQRTAAPTQGLMAPPPRPPTLNSLSAKPGSGRNGLLAAPVARPSPLPNRSYDRQPGSSTLAPPPSHSSIPAKPSRKVILEPGRSPLDWARLANSPASDLRNLPPGTPYLKVTPSMLKKQTGRKGKDAWTALNGRVYNISPYLPFHPGGEPELLRCAGRDGTQLFGEIHPWVNYETMLASSMIGLFVEEHEIQESSGMDDMD